MTSKQKQTKRMMGLSMAVLLSAALITACSDNNANTPDQNPANMNTNNGTVNQNQSAPDNPDGNGKAENSNDSAAQNDGTAGTDNNTSNNGAAEDTTQTGEGVFTGQVDPHSVEITTAGVPTVYQIDDRTADSILEIGQNDKVKFEYKEKKIDSGGEKVTQLWLTKIEKS